MKAETIICLNPERASALLIRANVGIHLELNSIMLGLKIGLQTVLHLVLTRSGVVLDVAGMMLKNGAKSSIEIGDR